MIAPRKYNGKKEVAIECDASRKLKKAAAWFAIAFLVVIAVVFMVRKADTENTNVIEKSNPRKAAKCRDVAKVRTEKPVQPQNDQIIEEPQIEVKRYGRSSNVPTSNTNNIRYASQTGLKITDADGNVREVRSKPIFKSRADDMLWAAVRPGGMPSGLNALRSRMRFQTGSDEAFLSALRNQDITVEADDPPHVVNAKKMTIEIKQGIIAELDNGRSFDDIYKEICTETKKERMYERIAQEDMRKIAKERDALAMRQYIEDMNPVMREMGLKELRLPSWAAEDGSANKSVDN